MMSFASDSFNSCSISAPQPALKRMQNPTAMDARGNDRSGARMRGTQTTTPFPKRPFQARAVVLGSRRRKVGRSRMAKSKDTGAANAAPTRFYANLEAFLEQEPR